jgi:hypothetical protein
VSVQAIRIRIVHPLSVVENGTSALRQSLVPISIFPDIVEAFSKPSASKNSDEIAGRYSKVGTRRVPPAKPEGSIWRQR